MINNIVLSVLLVLFPGCTQKESDEILMFQDNIDEDFVFDVSSARIRNWEDYESEAEEDGFRDISESQFEEVIGHIKELSQNFAEFRLALVRHYSMDYFFIYDAYSTDFFCIFVNKDSGDIRISTYFGGKNMCALE